MSQQWVNPDYAELVAEYERLAQDGPVRGFLIDPTTGEQESSQPE